MPFISKANENREIKGREYQLQAKMGQNYYSIYFELYGFTLPK